MPSHRRIDDHELTNLRRSLGASGGLPRDQVERLIAELQLLRTERREIAEVIERLRGSWPEVRCALNELDSLMRARPDPPG